LRARVTMSFRDKYTNIIYGKGQVIEVTKERYEELSSTALGSFVEAIERLPAPAPEPTPEPKKETKKPATKPKKRKK